MSLKILCIGDPHFKADNQLETDLLESQLHARIVEIQPEIVVVLGDILHTNEKLNLHIQKRAINFLRMLKTVSPYLYILIGNHDRPNNNVFLTDDHPFTSLKEWGERVRVVDTPLVAEHYGATLAFVPYVPPGRFEEALKIGGLEPPYSNITCIFAHQEFKGCKMSAITSTEGDEYPLHYPMCISGHIHDFDQLQSNLIYTGTPIQHTCSDRGDKTVSLCTFGPLTPEPPDVQPLPSGNDTPPGSEVGSGASSPRNPPRWTLLQHQRLALKIGKRLNLKLTPEELLAFICPPDAKVRIRVLGEVQVLRDLMRTDHVRQLLALGVKIEECPVNQTTIALPIQLHIRTTFQDRLHQTGLQLPTDLQPTFFHLFPQFKVHDVPGCNSGSVGT
jgi:hypothetical protein